MANLKSSQKDVRRTQRRTVRNVAVKSQLKTLAKKFTVLAAKNAPELKAAARAYVSALDKAVKRGLVHANSAARHKAQVAKLAKI